MAEFCLDCINKLGETNYTAKEYVLSKELDLCEECREYKQVVIRLKYKYILAERLREVIEGLKRT